MFVSRRSLRTNFEGIVSFFVVEFGLWLGREHKGTGGVSSVSDIHFQQSLRQERSATDQERNFAVETRNTLLGLVILGSPCWLVRVGQGALGHCHLLLAFQGVLVSSDDMTI